MVNKQLLTKNGRILLLSSKLAIALEAGSLIYGMTKAAIENFAKGLQIELGNQDSVFTVNPGITNTEMQQLLREEASPGFKHRKLLYEQLKNNLQDIDHVGEKIVNRILT